MKATINKIINFSNVDGPFNVTAIFFQGCNYNCWFCHNPETINKCLNCGDCVKTCPSKALSMVDNKVVYDQSKCVDCDACIHTCKHSSSPKTNEYDVDQLMKVIEKNKFFIKGITVSGGECTLNEQFLIELFSRAQKLGLKCLIDSNGSLDFEKHQELLNVCDGVMLDVKASDDDFHQRLTNFSNKIVLKNLSYLLSVNKLLEVRTVVLNDQSNNIKTVNDVLDIISDQVDYKLNIYRPFGVSEQGKLLCGDDIISDDIVNELLALMKDKPNKIVIR
ncbi:MAG: YjjW family glycine radical enzyme activase [Erysipelotrichaceae bacterium]